VLIDKVQMLKMYLVNVPILDNLQVDIGRGASRWFHGGGSS
jgi:hypothetical protein